MKKLKLVAFKLPLFMLLLLLIPLIVVSIINYQKTSILEMAILPKEEIERASKRAPKIFKDYEKILTQVSESEEVQYDSYTFDNEAGSYSNLPEEKDRKSVV